MPEVAADPVEPGQDQSQMPMDTGAPDTSAKGAPPAVATPETGLAGAAPVKAPAKDAPKGKSAGKDEPPAIGTGFPDPAAKPDEADEPRKAGDGNVILAPVPPLGSVTLPPLEEGGEGVIIDAAGTEVDEETALRAHAAAAGAGFRLREL